MGNIFQIFIFSNCLKLLSDIGCHKVNLMLLLSSPLEMYRKTIELPLASAWALSVLLALAIALVFAKC